jgi:hypothetical protein
MAEQGPGDFLHRFDARAHDLLAPIIEEFSGQHDALQRKPLLEFFDLIGERCRISDIAVARLKYVSPRLRGSLAGGERQQGSGAGESVVVELAKGEAIEAGMIGRDSMLGATSALDGEVSLNKDMGLSC